MSFAQKQGGVDGGEQKDCTAVTSSGANFKAMHRWVQASFL